MSDRYRERGIYVTQSTRGLYMSNKSRPLVYLSDLIFICKEVFQQESIDFKSRFFEISSQVSFNYLFKVTIVSDRGT